MLEKINQLTSLKKLQMNDRIIKEEEYQKLVKSQTVVEELLLVIYNLRTKLNNIECAWLNHSGYNNHTKR